MRALKIAGYVVAGLFAFVAIALLLIVIFVDPNDYRDRIEQAVEAETGRELTLAGDLSLSVFPWIALEIGAATLGDAPGFGDEPFVSIEEARVSARLLPLLRGKVEVGSIRLVGARIRLITDEQGRNNWDDLGGEETEESEPTAQRELPTIAGLEIRDAAVTIENRQEDTRQVIRDFSLETGRLESGEPFALEASFILDQDPSMSVGVRLAAIVTADLERNIHSLADPEIGLTVSGADFPAEGLPIGVRASALQADVGRETYALDGLSVVASWQGEGYPAAGVPIALKAQRFAANLAQQSLELSGLDLDVAGAHITGNLTGVEILDAPNLRGPLQLDPVSLREWLPKLGIDVPNTEDPEVLKRLSFTSTVALTKTSAELGDIVLQLDDTTAKGMFGVADFEAKALRFDLSVDRIDADRYLPPPSDAPASEGEEPPTEIPVDALRALNARGQLAIGEAVFAGMTFTKMRLGINADGGKVRFHPSEAALYGGQYRGDISIDATGKAARVSLDERISGVDFAPLFKDFFETDRVSGRGGLNLKVAGRGSTTDDIVKTLNGTVDFKVADGALEGADLWYEIRRARAVLRRQAIPERSGPVRTPFTALTGSGVFNDGVMRNEDLNVAMQYLKVAGEGTVDLPNDTLDYRLMTTVLKIPREGAETAEMEELVDAEIPVRITGALTDPKVRPDLEGYLKGQVKERVQEEREKIEEKVKEKIGDKLKDLFGG